MNEIMTNDEKLSCLTEIFGRSFTNQISDNPEAIEFYYKASRVYDMSITDADDWAWLNTLFQYDIGAYHARDIIDWYYYEHDSTVMDAVDADSKDTLSNICSLELGHHLDFSHWVKEEPKALRFGYKEWYEPWE